MSGKENAYKKNKINKKSNKRTCIVEADQAEVVVDNVAQTATTAQQGSVWGMVLYLIVVLFREIRNDHCTCQQRIPLSLRPGNEHS